jgi:hypothetical protein
MTNEPTSQNEEQDQSGIFWYIAGAMLVVLGLIGGTGAVVYGVTEVMKVGDQLHRFKIPGTHELQLKKSGTHTVYHEFSSQLDGETFRTSGKDLNQYKFTLHPKNEPDREIPLETGMSSSTYDFGNRQGRSLYTFHVDEPGKYVFEARTKNEKKGKGATTEVVLTVGQSVVLSMFKNIGFILGGVCFFLVFIGGGVAMIIIRVMS